MLRRVCCSAPSTSFACVGAALEEAQRGIRYGSIQETLKPTSGQSAGQLSIMNEICTNPDAEEERRKPAFRVELAPKRKRASYLSTMYRWGYNSLTMFHKANEDPGPWWNANSSTLVSTWSQLGDYANAGMWSGVWRYTYGVGNYNMRPFETRGRAWGRKDRKSRALTVDYEDNLASTPAQKLMFPHTKEHQLHQRIKNPALPGFVELDGLHGKRVMREIQHHLGNGIRFYLVDGVFGSYNGSATPYRIITDNPTSAYFASLAAIRKLNYVAQEESVLIKRVSQSPMDEWAWRRPGVLVYHAPSFEFEAPRIVEEFGGPRPQDFSLTTPKFIALEPYSIPMKGIVGADPRCETLLDTVAFLCARWGFYADNKNLVTIPGDSVMSPDGASVTLVVGDKTDALKASPHVFGAHHHRLDDALIARAWDVTSAPLSKGAAPSENDLVESSEKRIHKPLPLRMGLERAVSHRMFGRRRVSEFGFKRPHNYTDDAATRADQGGHLFGGAAQNQLKAHPPRTNAMGIASLNVVVVGTKPSNVVADAVAVMLEQFSKDGFMYAESDKLSAVLARVLGKAKSVQVIAQGTAAAELAKLAKTGAL